MREELDSLREIFFLYRHELGYSFVACCVAMLRHWQKGDPFREIFTNGLLCAFAAFGLKEIFHFFDMPMETSGYLASVLLGYVGVEVLLNALPFKIPMTRQAKRKE